MLDNNEVDEIPSSSSAIKSDVPSKPEAESEPALKKLKTHMNLLVNPRQKGNPILKHVQKCSWEFADIVADYEMGPQVAAIYLSLQYHSIKPDYIHERLKLLGKSYTLRVLIVRVDVSDPYPILKTLTRISILADLTLMLAWSDEEASNILVTYKVYENKPVDKIRGFKEANHYNNLVNALACITPINKTDAVMLLSRYKTLAKIIKCSQDELEKIPGFGQKKAQVLSSVLRSNFYLDKKRHE